MEWMNYHHLQYFWMVAREGSVTAASEKLRLAQPTVSAQVKRLEQVLGTPLLARQGRKLMLTDAGRVAFRYADEIFKTGQDLLDAIRLGQEGRRVPLTVGVASTMPKLVVTRLLRPVMAGPDAMGLVCRQESAEQLMAQLATHALDVVLSDVPAPPHVRVKVFNHVLGESEIAFFGRPRTAAKLRRRFPASLTSVPIALPTRNTALRRDIDAWLEARKLIPTVVAEFEDPALMKAFASEADLLFPAPVAAEREICRLYDVRVAGRVPVQERYYAISVERRLTHPGVLAITGAARDDVFS